MAPTYAMLDATPFLLDPTTSVARLIIKGLGLQVRS